MDSFFSFYLYGYLTHYGNYFDNSGYHEILPLHFPRTWSYEERKDFVERLGIVLRREIAIYEFDKIPFENGMSNEEYDNAMEYFHLLERQRREFWEAQDCHDARGDV